MEREKDKTEKLFKDHLECHCSSNQNKVTGNSSKMKLIFFLISIKLAYSDGKK